MKIDIQLLNDEDRKYADEWEGFLPFADIDYRKAVIGQIHHTIMNIKEQDGQCAFRTRAEVSVACACVIVMTNVLNDIISAATIQRFLGTLGVDAETLGRSLMSHFKSHRIHTGTLETYVMTSPLSTYQGVNEAMVGDGTVVGYGSGSEAETYIACRLPPAIVIVGDVGKTCPSCVDDNYTIVHLGSSDPIDEDFGLTSFVRNDLLHSFDDPDAIVDHTDF